MGLEAPLRDVRKPCLDAEPHLDLIWSRDPDPVVRYENRILTVRDSLPNRLECTCFWKDHFEPGQSASADGLGPIVPGVRPEVVVLPASRHEHCVWHDRLDLEPDGIHIEVSERLQ